MSIQSQPVVYLIGCFTNTMENTNYTFVHVSERSCKALEGREIQDMLMKWSMKGSLQVQYYSFNQPFKAHEKQQFFTAFFKDPVVYSTLTYNQVVVGKPASSVKLDPVPCTVLSMDFFDRLLEPDNNIVRCDGKSIVQCQEEDIDGFMIDDNLRSLILNREGEFYSLFSESERKQFLWRIFCHLCLGGQWCQFEFVLQPYLDAAKLLYKELVSVERIGDSSELVVRSIVFRIVVFDEDDKPLIPQDPENVQNFLYLIVDPFKRSMAVISHCYAGYFTS